MRRKWGPEELFSWRAEELWNRISPGRQETDTSLSNQQSLSHLRGDGEAFLGGREERHNEGAPARSDILWGSTENALGSAPAAWEVQNQQPLSSPLFLCISFLFNSLFLCNWWQWTLPLFSFSFPQDYCSLLTSAHGSCFLLSPQGLSLTAFSTASLRGLSGRWAMRVGAFFGHNFPSKSCCVMSQKPI